MIGGGSRSEAPGAKALQVSWMQQKEKAIDALARWISQMSSLFPFMLIVDDAQLLDPESADVLRVISRDAVPGRLLLLAAARGEVSLAVSARRIRLEELDARCVSAMSASTLSPVELGEVLGVRLHQLYGGLPALIVEALRSVSVLLPLAAARRPPDTPELVESVLRQLPRGIDELLMARYTSLDRERQLTLDILSCFTWPARLEVIQSVLPFRPRRTVAYLFSLEAEGFVASHDDGQRFVMRHARLKSLVYEEIGENRQESHLVIASTMEGFTGVRTVSDLQELAYQYRAGGKDAAGIRWLEAAGDEGMRIAAHRMAKELFREAVLLAGGALPSDRDRLNVKLARALFSCGDFREAVDRAEEQLGRAPGDLLQQATLHETAGFANSRLGNYEESKRHIVAALQYPVDSTIGMELEQELVGIEIATGNFAEAERLGLAQLARAKDLGDPGIIGSIHNDLGIAMFYQNLLDQSAGHFEESMKIYAASGQHMRVADAMMNIANVMSAKGDIAGAAGHLSSALATSREYGSLNQQAQIQNNLGIAHFKLNRFPEARSFYDEASAIFTRLDSRQGSALVLTNLGEVNFAEGRYEQAMLVWEESLRLHRDMDDGQGIVETLLHLVQVHCALGAVEPAGRNLDEAEQLITGRGLQTFRFQLLWLRGMHMMLLDRYEAARSFFTQSEQSPPEEEEAERRLLLRVRMAECEYFLGAEGAAVAIASQARDSAERTAHPQAVADASYLLGRIAAASPSSVPEKPLSFFRTGFDAIATEPITELTWKLAVALGEEFHKRGQGNRAKDCFAKGRLVLRFLLAQFTSSELKNSYLGVDDKRKVLAALEAYLNT
jgi:tetratricopeptide (TPR) repeat protein